MKKRLTMMLIYIITIFSVVNFAQVPVITKEPVSIGVIEGQTANFFIQVQGDSLTYQWYKNDTLIVAATDSAYTTPATVLSDNLANFKCIVTNPSGADTSTKATLYVTAIGSRVTEGIQVLYNFKEAGGTLVNDSSGAGAPYNLDLDNPSSVTWTPNGMGVNDVSYINGKSPLTKVIDACKLTNEVTIEIWIKPAYASQEDGPRILTLSNDNNSAFNFAVLQFPDKSLTFRLSSTDVLHPDYLPTPSGAVTEDLTHFVFSRNSNGERKIYKNGAEIAADTLGGDFSNWVSSARFQLANEFIDLGVNSWLGTYYLVSIYNRALNQPEIAGNYSVGVSSDKAPVIVIEPNDQGVFVGDPAVFSVKIVGDSSTYQWKKDGIDILGANSSTYTIPSVTALDDRGEYSCVVSNSFGSDTSRIAVLYVTALNTYVESGQTALYTFREGSGNIVYDVLGYLPEDLAVTWQSVEWKPYGLLVDSIGAIYSTGEAPKFTDEAVTSGEFTFEAWVKPANVAQSSATIVSYGNSGDPSRINFIMEQSGGLIRSWIRTTSTTEEGALLESPANSLGDSLVHIVFTYNRKEIAKIFINGKEVSSTYVVGDLSGWNPVYYLKLANAWGVNKPWLGLFNYVSFFRRALNSNEILYNYSRGALGVSLKAPDSLTAQANQPGKVELAWKDSSNNEDGFIIERKHGALSFAVIDTVGIDAVTYTDSSVVDTTNYTYRVKAYNYADQSDYSNLASVTTILSSLAAPSNLTAKLFGTSNQYVQLNWLDNSSNELGFVIERKNGDTSIVAPFILIDSVTTDVTTYIDSTVVLDSTYSYRIYAFNTFFVSNYSNLSDVRVPVELVSFTADVINGNVNLRWETASEINNAGFSVQRSTDNTKFTDIAFIKGIGTTTDKSTYSYSDKSTLSGKSYYRLKQIDFDGSATYSQSIEIELGVPKDYALEQNYPNPFNPSTTIRFALPVNGKVSIKLFNALGQEVANALNSELEAGIHEIAFNASNLSSGVYFYMLKVQGANGSNFTSTKRMVFMK